MPTDQNIKDLSHFKTWNQIKWKPSKAQLDQFTQLQKLLREWNKRTNITRLIDGDDFWVAQVCDSLMPFKEELQDPNLPHKFIDVGSGCGFPGIAIAIAMPNSKLTLLDSSSKKTAFLKEVSTQLGLNSRITILTERAESAGKNPVFRGDFDYALARAVAPATVVAEYLVPFLNSQGQALIYKGSWNETEEHILNKALLELNAEIRNTYNFSLPEKRGIRNIIRVIRTKDCPKQYPRSIGKPKKKPLGH